ncbi:hypothetical protein Tco_0921512 [Tanacetum coccineum]
MSRIVVLVEPTNERYHTYRNVIHVGFPLHPELSALEKVAHRATSDNNAAFIFEIDKAVRFPPLSTNVIDTPVRSLWHSSQLGIEMNHVKMKPLYNINDFELGAFQSLGVISKIPRVYKIPVHKCRQIPLFEQVASSRGGRICRLQSKAPVVLWHGQFNDGNSPSRDLRIGVNTLSLESSVFHMQEYSADACLSLRNLGCKAPDEDSSPDVVEGGVCEGGDPGEALESLAYLSSLVSSLALSSIKVLIFITMIDPVCCIMPISVFTCPPVVYSPPTCVGAKFPSNRRRRSLNRAQKRALLHALQMT